MNFPLRNIIIIVLLALTGIFLWQLYWLRGLYKSERATLDKTINDALEYSDFGEMEARFDSLSRSGRFKGNISVSASMGEKDSTGGHNWRRTSTKELTKAPVMGHKPIVKELDSGRDTSLTALLNLSEITRKALHQQIDGMLKPDIQRYDSLLTEQLKKNGINVKHRVLLLKNCRAVASAGTAGFTPDRNSETYTLDLYDADNGSKVQIRLFTEPLTATLLTQMAGILSASLLIIIVLAFVFWYLVHTLVRIRNLDEMKTDFSNNITHELKTPIAVALAANDALLNYGADADVARRKEYLTICREQLNRLGGMVEQILSMSMERRRNMALNITDVNVKDIVDSLVHEHTLKAGKKVTFTTSIAPEDMTLKADPMHFRNIMSNLIDNALKYSHDSVYITIRATKNDGGAEISVEDNGIGIARDRLRYVFDRFYRVMDGNRYTVKGYGLGLFYVKSMTERMGGTVSVSSRQGEGTIFKLHFNE